MITDRILFFSNYPLNNTDGGPSGVLAQNLVGYESEFYQINNPDVKSTLLSKITRKIHNSFANKRIKDAGLDKLNTFKEWTISSQKIFINNLVHRYKFIHFHDVCTMKACLPLIKPSQVVLLQSYCPELPSLEIASQPDFSQSDIEWTKEAEGDAFKRANILIFPNQYAANIYTPLISPKSQIFYLPYGAKKVRDLRQYPLNSPINLLYIGRRNQIKGFDLTIESFKEVYKSRKDINLILVGKGEKVNEEGVFDVGFSSTPHHWINSCDYLLNCNRQSYWDLIILETLSIGTPIIMAPNFGHKQFIEDNSEGIINIGEPTVENLTNILSSPLIKKKEYNQEAMRQNRFLYENKYSDSIYRERLENLMQHIINTY